MNILNLDDINIKSILYDLLMEKQNIEDSIQKLQEELTRRAVEKEQKEQKKQEKG